MSVVDAERVRAAARSLLYGGDITPAGARFLQRIADDPDEETPQTIDREKALRDAEAALVQRRQQDGSGQTDVQVVVDAVLALIRPIDGIVLTREEAEWCCDLVSLEREYAAGNRDYDEDGARGLIAKLGGAS